MHERSWSGLSVWSPKHIYILVKRGTNFDFRADLHWDRPRVGQTDGQSDTGKSICPTSPNVVGT